MRTPTPDTDECQEKWKALKIGEQLLFAYKLARLLEQQRDEARFVAYGLSGGSVGSKIEANYPLTAVWGNHYRRMILTKAKAKKEKKALDEEKITLADGFADAFLGIGRQFGKPMAVYSRRKCIEVLMRDMDQEQAEEYFEFNLAGAWLGETTPIYLEELE